MNTERIPPILAQALMAFDGQFPTPSLGENGGCEDEGPSFRQVSQINSSSPAAAFRINPLLKYSKAAAMKNEIVVTPSEPRLENNPDALDGFERGLRFLHPYPQAPDHLDI